MITLSFVIVIIHIYSFVIIVNHLRLIIATPMPPLLSDAARRVPW
jgi:hypothetical protein